MRGNAPAQAFWDNVRHDIRTVPGVLLIAATVIGILGLVPGLVNALSHSFMFLYVVAYTILIFSIAGWTLVSVIALVRSLRLKSEQRPS